MIVLWLQILQLALIQAEPEPEANLMNFMEKNPLFTDEGHLIIEGDIALSPEQRDRYENRQLYTGNRWANNHMKYKISSESEAYRQAIVDGVKMWSDGTCFTFEEVPLATTLNEGHVKVINASGCWSYVGRISSSGAQSLSLGPGCGAASVAAHEFGHAMGLHHTQTRWDRDNYVMINEENIPSGKMHNFNKKSQASYPTHGVPYDFSSLMHYGRYDFSKNNKPTIQAINPRFDGLVGSKGRLTFRDKAIINIGLNCAASCSAASCTTNQLTCENGGYIDKTCGCNCPPNTNGTTCDTLTGDYYGRMCGSEVNTEGTLTSVNYPSTFPPSQTCTWMITAPVGKYIKFNFTEFHMLYRSGGNCWWDYMELRLGDKYTQTMKKCQEELKNKVFTTDSNMAVVIFRASGYARNYRGWSTSLNFVDTNIPFS